jgi:hypothetical protein
MNDFELDNWEYSCEIKGSCGKGIFNVENTPIKILYDGQYHEYQFTTDGSYIQIRLDGDIVYDSCLFRNASKSKHATMDRELRKIERSYWRHL